MLLEYAGRHVWHTRPQNTFPAGNRGLNNNNILKLLTGLRKCVSEVLNFLMSKDDLEAREKGSLQQPSLPLGSKLKASMKLIVV